MKLNKKILSIILAVLVILIIIIVCLINKKNNVLCELNTDSLNTKINIELNKNITFSYDYLFDSMDETVDKYDSINSYLKIIKKIDGVNTNLDQNEYKVNYSINIELEKINEEDYKVLNITDLVKFKSIKEIMKYYENQGFTCEIK